MPTVIRFARHGTKKRPYYRMVVQDSRFKRDGRFIEHIGAYNPLVDRSLTVKKARLEYWLSVGAQPSKAVLNRLDAADKPPRKEKQRISQKAEAKLTQQAEAKNAPAAPPEKAEAKKPEAAPAEKAEAKKPEVAAAPADKAKTEEKKPSEEKPKEEAKPSEPKEKPSTP